MKDRTYPIHVTMELQWSTRGKAGAGHPTLTSAMPVNLKECCSVKHHTFIACGFRKRKTQAANDLLLAARWHPPRISSKVGVQAEVPVIGFSPPTVPVPTLYDTKGLYYYSCTYIVLCSRPLVGHAESSQGPSA